MEHVLSPSPPILASVVSRWEVPKGTFSYFQDVAFIYWLFTAFFLLPHPLYTCPVFPAPFPKVLFLFHLAAPFLNRLTTTRQGEKPAWLLPPSLPKQMLPADPVVPCKPRWGLSASAVPWHGGMGLSAMWALKPCQQAWTQLPRQPTSSRVWSWLLVRCSMVMSWWWVPGFPKMPDLDRTVHMREAQL